MVVFGAHYFINNTLYVFCEIFKELLEVSLQEISACWIPQSSGLCCAGLGRLVLSKVSPL